MELAGFDERRDARPILRSFIMARKQRILAIDHEGADASFDDICIEFDAAVFDEAGEPVPMMQGIADRLCGEGLPREAIRRAPSR